MPALVEAGAHLCGAIATVCATAQYVPQLHLNWQRHSTRGLSPVSIVMKLVGSSFLLFNSLFLRETTPVIFYGLGNVLTHTLFMFQFHAYNPARSTGGATAKEESRAAAFVRTYKYLLWALFPVVPLLLDLAYPALIRLFPSYTRTHAHANG